VVRELSAELWHRAQAVLGEGPQWDPRRQRLSWVDLESSRLHVDDAQGRPLASYQLPGHVGAALPAQEGGWLVALPDRLAVLDEAGGLEDVVALEAHIPGNRSNDAKCDPAGRAWVGTMAYDESTINGTLFRLDPGRRLTPVLRGVGISNGMAWDAAGATMYYVDSAAQEVRAYPFDRGTGALGTPEVLVLVDEGDGHPDGLCIDDEGCLWVALFGGSAVHRYTPAGQLDTVVRVPASYTTSCCFGGPRNDQLFITSARRGLTPADLARQPEAGSVWAAYPGVSGPPPVLWGG